MKTLIVRQNGRMDPVETALPALAPGKIRVRVRYAGVGFADLMAVRGGYALAPRTPFSPGYEFAGVVEATGVAETSLETGQAIAGMLPVMACYREFLDIDPVWAVAVPTGLPLRTAALMPLNYLTALALLEKKARLAAGQSFLIHGAAGGVGSAVLEMARLNGLRAYGTGSAAKLADIAAAGARPLEMKEGWLSELRRMEPEGVDAAFDSSGGRLLADSYRSVARRGSLVSYGFAPTADGGNGPFVAGLWFHLRKSLVPDGRRLAICGTPGIIAGDRRWYRENLAACLQLARDGGLTPRLHAVFPWRKAAEAHLAISERRVRGKSLLEFSPGEHD